MSNDTSDRGTTRRRLLQSSVLAGSVALAGCSGERSGEASDDEGEDERILASWGTGIVGPDYMGFNPWGDKEEGHMKKLTSTPPLYLNTRTGEFESVLLDDWGVDQSEGEYGVAWFEITDGITWHQHDREVEAEDLKVQYQVDRYVKKGDYHQFVDEIRAPEDKRLEFVLSEPVNPFYFLTMFRRWAYPHGPKELFEDWRDRLFEAGDPPTESAFWDLGGLYDGEFDVDGAVAEILIEIRETRWTDESYGCGPFEFELSSEDAMICSIHEGFPNADELNFEYANAVSTYSGDTLEMYEKGTYAVYSHPDPDTAAAIEDFSSEVRLRNYGGIQLEIPRHGWGGDLAVRKALNYVVDAEAITEELGPGHLHHSPPCQVADHVQDEWLDPDVVEAMNDYEADHDRATTLLEEAGFSSEDGEWYTPDGDRFRFDTCAYDDWGHDWDGAAELVSEQLSAFGIASEFRGDDPRDFFERRDRVDEASEVLWTHFVGGSGFEPFPQNWFHWNTWTDWSQVEGTIEVPPVGEPDADPELEIEVDYDPGDVEERPIEERPLPERMKYVEDDDLREMVQTMAWAWNQDVPGITVLHWEDRTFVNDEYWEVPDPDDDSWGFIEPQFSGLHRGTFTARKSNDPLWADHEPPETPENLEVVEKGASTLTLEWDEASDAPNGIGLDHYRIYLDGERFDEIEETRWETDRLSQDTEYEIEVVSVDRVDNESEPATVTVRTDEGDLDSYTIIGSGWIWGDAGDLGFAYTEVTGDVTFTARMTHQQETVGWSKAGVMIRDSLESSAAHVTAAVEGSGNLGTLWRPADSEESEFDDGVAVVDVDGVPVWLRVERSGNEVTTAFSADGEEWTEGHTVEIASEDPVYVGLAADSQEDGVVREVSFDHVDSLPPQPDVATIGENWPEGEEAELR